MDSASLLEHSLTTQHARSLFTDCLPFQTAPSPVLPPFSFSWCKNPSKEQLFLCYLSPACSPHPIISWPTWLSDCTFPLISIPITWEGRIQPAPSVLAKAYHLSISLLYDTHSGLYWIIKMSEEVLVHGFVNTVLATWADPKILFKSKERSMLFQAPYCQMGGGDSLETCRTSDLVHKVANGSNKMKG